MGKKVLVGLVLNNENEALKIKDELRHLYMDCVEAYGNNFNRFYLIDELSERFIYYTFKPTYLRILNLPDGYFEDIRYSDYIDNKYDIVGLELFNNTAFDIFGNFSKHTYSAFPVIYNDKIVGLPDSSRDNFGSDFLLIAGSCFTLLIDPLKREYNVFFNGMDLSNNTSNFIDRTMYLYKYIYSFNDTDLGLMVKELGDMSLLGNIAYCKANGGDIIFPSNINKISLSLYSHTEKCNVVFPPSLSELHLIGYRALNSEINLNFSKAVSIDILRNLTNDMEENASINDIIKRMKEFRIHINFY